MNRTSTKWTDTMQKQVAHCITLGYPEIDYLDCNPPRHATRSPLVKIQRQSKAHDWHITYKPTIPAQQIERLKFYRHLIERGEYNEGTM